MRRITIAFACLALLTCACSSKPAVKASTTRPGPSVKPASKPKTNAPLRSGSLSAPPIRIFAGTQSIQGTATHYCRDGKCLDRDAAPPSLPAAERSVVSFAIDTAPQTAVLDVSGAGARRVVLTPGSLMALQGPLAPGVHRLQLTLKWPGAEGIWLFEVQIKPAN